MKRIVTIALIAIITPVYSQVGIGTTEPTETLDIEGRLRVRETTPQTNTELVKIGGLDADGVFHEVAIGSNLVLKNNTLSAKTPFDHSYGSSIELDETPTAQTIDLKLKEGEENEGKTIIKLIYSGPEALSPSIEAIKVDGIRDGQQIWGLCDTQKIDLRINNAPGGTPGQILGRSSRPFYVVYRNEIVNLVYDAEVKKWRVANNIIL